MIRHKLLLFSPDPDSCPREVPVSRGQLCLSFRLCLRLNFCLCLRLRLCSKNKKKFSGDRGKSQEDSNNLLLLKAVSLPGKVIFYYSADWNQ
tara:strand:+ start:1539 stop:1814 length:276 start_codon:yes stop_codon:yes gene_type:complete